MEEQVCPACHKATKITPIYKGVYDAKDLIKCSLCGLCFIWPKPFSEESRQVYAKDYYDAWPVQELGAEVISGMKRTTSERLLNAVERHKNNGSLLDIGCGFGYLLEVAKERGWDCYGVEACEDVAKMAQKKLGSADRIWIGDFLSMPVTETNFDVIIAVDVMEHIYDIIGMLKKCSRLLRKDGLLAIVTPDMNSLSRKCLRKCWPHFNEGHVVYFSKNSARCILEANGFNILEASNFKKALNFLYIKSAGSMHQKKALIFLTEIMDNLLPAFIKRKNFLTLHGEMLIIAQKI